MSLFYDQVYFIFQIFLNISRIFDYDKNNDKEKRQLFELLKQLLKKTSDIQSIPVSIVRGLTFVATRQDDIYRMVAMEILRELGLIK